MNRLAQQRQWAGQSARVSGRFVWRPQQGLAALEAALALIPLILLLAFVASLGLFFLLKQNIAHAAGEAARVLVSQSVRHAEGAPVSACQAARAALADTTRWLDLEDPSCCVAPVAVAANALPQVSLSVGYAEDADSALIGTLNLFARFTGLDANWLLSSMLHSQVTAQVLVPLDNASCPV